MAKASASLGPAGKISLRLPANFCFFPGSTVSNDPAGPGTADPFMKSLSLTSDRDFLFKTVMFAFLFPGEPARPGVG
jgi:hypothetical protein